MVPFQLVEDQVRYDADGDDREDQVAAKRHPGGDLVL